MDDYVLDAWGRKIPKEKPMSTKNIVGEVLDEFDRQIAEQKEEEAFINKVAEEVERRMAAAEKQQEYREYEDSLPDIEKLARSMPQWADSPDKARLAAMGVLKRRIKHDDAPDIEPMGEIVTRIPGRDRFVKSTHRKVWYRPPHAFRSECTKGAVRRHEAKVAEIEALEESLKTEKKGHHEGIRTEIRKKKRELAEDPILNHYSILHKQARNMLSFWATWYKRASAVVDWREGRSDIPKWFYSSLKDTDEAQKQFEKDLAAGFGVPPAPEKPGMFSHVGPDKSVKVRQRRMVVDGDSVMTEREAAEKIRREKETPTDDNELVEPA